MNKLVLRLGTGLFDRVPKALGKTEFCRTKDFKLCRVIVRNVSLSHFLIYIYRVWFTMYKEVVLDESILDLDSWLPQSAIDEVVKLILHLEEQGGNAPLASLVKP